jgi:hypothetical protein
MRYIAVLSNPISCCGITLAAGKDAASPEQQEAALEGLLDLTRCLCNKAQHRMTAS